MRPSPRPLLLLLRTNLFVSGGVAALGAWVARIHGRPPAPGALLVLFAGTLLVYNLDHARDDRARQPARPRLGVGLRAAMLGAAALLLVLGFSLGGARMFALALAPGAVGLLYGATLGALRLKDLPGAKAWGVAAAVAWACAALPQADAARISVAPLPFLFGLAALNAFCFDLRDVAVDRSAGQDTWASRQPPRSAFFQVLFAATVFASAAALLARADLWPLSAAVAAITALASLPGVRPGAPRERFGLLVDGWLYLPLLASLTLETP